MNLIKLGAVNFNKHALKSLLGSRALHISSPLSDDKTFYEILRVPEDASQTEIKEAYYKLSKVYHPDIAKDENSLRMFRSITEAYDVLGNVRSRIEYDSATGIQSVAEQITFHPSGYKDANEYRKMYPDYDKILSRKSKQEDWEEFQLKERRIEVQTKKNNFYVEDDTFLWTHWERKLTRVGMALFAAMLAYKVVDEAYFEKYIDPPK